MSTPWHNWSDTIDFTVLELDEPTTLTELKQNVASAANAGLKVRIVGSGHSWSLGAVPGTEPYVPNLATGQHLIDISNMHPVNCAQDPYLKATYFEDGGVNLVAIPPGTTQGWLITNAGNSPAPIVPPPYNGYDPNHLYSNLHSNLAVQSAGPAPDITLGGFIANGCHGTGWENSTVADLVQAIEVVVWNGTDAVTKSYAVSASVQAACEAAGVFDSSPTVDPDALSAMRCSLGALGAISKMVLKVVPAFNVAHINEYVSNDVLFQADYLEQLVTSSDYVEIFWFPFNDESWVMRYSQAQPPTAPVQNEDQLGLFNVLNSVLAALTGNKLGQFFKDFPFLTPFTLNALWAAMKRFPGMRQLEDVDFWTDYNAGSTQVVAPLWMAYLYQLAYFTNLLDLSYTVPIPAKNGGGHDFSNVISAWNDALAEIDNMQQNHKYPLNLNVHIRFIKKSEALLSPAVWPEDTNHTCYIEFLSFSEQEAEYQEYSDVVGQQWNNLGGLPHWAKAFQFVSNGFSASHSKLQARGSLASFEPQVTANDPTGLFNNDFLNQLLRGQAAPQVEPAARVKAAARPAKLPSKRFPFDSAEAWAAAQRKFGGQGVSLAGAGTLYLQEDGHGALLDARQQIHPLQTSFDPKTNRATFTLLTQSQFLSAGELFGAIGAILRAN